MDLAFLPAALTFLADIPAPVPPPPPSNLVVGPLAGNVVASLAFWALAIVAVTGLWWLRRRRSIPLDQAAAEPR